MLKIDRLFGVLDEIAPISLSYKLVESGDYDNSGVLINCHSDVENVLFSLDFSIQAIKKAKSLKCDTIVTHHPAIYTPQKSISYEDETSASVLLAIKNDLNVISMHLNLDMATTGTDYQFCKGLGGEKYKILEYMDEEHGYGREFDIENVKLSEFVARIKKQFNTKRVVVYGNKNAVLTKGASFCGGGSDHALKSVKKGKTSAQVIVTSDMPHHVIKELVEAGKNVVLVTHYASENYGFKKYFEQVKNDLKNKVNAFYFEDKRFM